MEVRYMEPCALAAALRHPQHKDKVLVLDVRDEDFAGGHVRGALNVPSEDWGHDAHIDEVIDSHVVGKDVVVVHCMFSQERGPRCALRLAKRISARDDLRATPPSLYVLRGGFKTFAHHYRHEKDLVDGLH